MEIYLGKEHVQSVLSLFKWMIEMKPCIQDDDSTIDFDSTMGLCSNVVEHSKDHSERILQALFRKYFNIPENCFVPDYPFSTRDDLDPQEEYRQTQNMYADTPYGNLRWTFIVWAIEELENNFVSYIND